MSLWQVNWTKVYRAGNVSDSRELYTIDEKCTLLSMQIGVLSDALKTEKKRLIHTASVVVRLTQYMPTSMSSSMSMMQLTKLILIHFLPYLS